MSVFDPQAALESPLTASRPVPTPLWALHGEATSGSVGVHPIDATPFTIGRSTQNSLRLGDPTVSSRHAELVAIADSLIVRDLGSTNGTFLNGRRVASHEMVGRGDVVQFGAIAFELRNAGGSQTSTNNCTLAANVADDALAFVQFEKMINDRSFTPFFQPIVDHHGATKAYEVLVRSRIFGLESPDAMFRAAARLQSEVTLSRLIRQEGVRAAADFPADLSFFVNTHPAELREPGLVDSIWALRRAFPTTRIVLEIHESAVTSGADMRALSTALHEQDVQLAYDDFGAGQSRLQELTDVLPAYVKFDIGLVRGLDTATPQRRGVVESLVHMVRDLGVIPLAEGVETEAEAEACWDAGFLLGQGFHFGRPGPVRDYAPDTPPDEETTGPFD